MSERKGVEIYKRETFSEMQDAADYLGMSLSAFIQDEMFPYWLNHAESDGTVRELRKQVRKKIQIRKSKERQRKSGDLLGSYEKLHDKLLRADKEFDKKKIKFIDYYLHVLTTYEDYYKSQAAATNVLREEADFPPVKRKKVNLNLYRMTCPSCFHLYYRIRVRADVDDVICINPEHKSKEDKSYLQTKGLIKKKINSLESHQIEKLSKKLIHKET